MNFDIEKIVNILRVAFRAVLWLMIAVSMYSSEWTQSIAAAVILAVLELEEINEKMDN